MNFYHASPENFSRFTPKYSKTFKCKGVFVSPTFKSTIKDWAFYVLNKKNKKADFINYKISNYYSYIWMYTIELPRNIIQECREFYQEVFDSEDWHEGYLFSFWYWGDQLFIPEWLVNEIKIIKKKKYKLGKLCRLYSYLVNKDWENNTLQFIKKEIDKNDIL